jgi:hypothetical protein
VIFPSPYNSDPFPELPPGISAQSTGWSLDRQIEQHRQRCAEEIRRAMNLAVVDLPGIEAYRKLRLEALDDECRFNELFLRALYGDVSALRAYTPSVAKCSSYIDALEGKADLMEAWRGLPGVSRCQSPDEIRKNPEVCRLYPELGKFEDMDHVRHDVLTLGWSNCSARFTKIADTKRFDDLRAALAHEFDRRFKLKRAACSE